MFDYEGTKDQIVGNIIRALVTIPWLIFLTLLTLKIACETVWDHLRGRNNVG